MKQPLSLLLQSLLLTLLASAPAAETDPLAIAPGPFQPSWDSLSSQYQVPEWYRDAKFGIWAHWGPQCQPAAGDWYARKMYMEGEPDYRFHLAHYGHPSKVGFKDVIHQWKAEHFDPDKLLAFYKENGARYFMALANHHDNLDNYASKYQPWNSVAVGPKKDLIGLWAAAARKNGLRFGVSVHAARAWSWYEPAQGADKTGEFAGVPYDGKLTRAQGQGQWWEGLDPQELYAQNHAPKQKLVWDGTPDSAAEDYMLKFFRRTKQLWDDYQPDLVYFDDGVLPFRGVTDEIGLRLAAHFYNSSLKNNGRNEAVMNTKKLEGLQRKALVYDIERGKAEAILPEPWQTDTCIGSWHYNTSIYERHAYRSADSVIRMLADIVSKNGNLMLSVPLRGDGTPDEDEIRIVKEIGAWLRVNGEAIYATRPWKICGEGPALKAGEKGRFGGVADSDKQPLTHEDIRFTSSRDGKALYALVLSAPADGQLKIKSLAANSAYGPASIARVQLLGREGNLKFQRSEAALEVTLPPQKSASPVLALKITGD